MPARKAPRTRRDLVRLADLAPKREITGGSQQRVFGSDTIAADQAKPETRKRAKNVPTPRK
jgi:hypothetical protein